MIRPGLVVLIAALAGCVGAPKTNTGEIVWYEREPDLTVQSEAYKAHCVSLVSSEGVFSYRAYKPWGPSGAELDNYLLSHDMADYPAWQGLLVAALAFEGATTGADNDALLGRLARGYLASFDAHGVEGLLTRCVIPDYTGPRQEWMETEAQRPTKFWTQGQGGVWYRNGVAKNHTNLTMVGTGIALHLHREGMLDLSTETWDALRRVLVSTVTYLANGGWRIADAHGGWTEFGDLRPDVTFGPSWPALKGLPNGFNRVVVLQGLLSAGHYDARLKALYEDLAPKWAPGIAQSMEVAGEAVRAVGHWKIGKPSFSDMQAYSLASLGLLLQEDRRELTKDYRKGLNGLWQFMRYERNATFNLTFHLVRPDESRIADVIEDLRQYPRPQDKGSWQIEYRDSSKVQPLGNRPTNSNYYKSSPFKRVYYNPANPPLPVLHPRTGARQLQGGQDFLLAYWLGRYLGAIPEGS